MFTRPGEARTTHASWATDRRTDAGRWHVHWFRHVGDDPFSGAGLYACRCGVVRPGF